MIDIDMIFFAVFLMSFTVQAALISSTCKNCYRLARNSSHSPIRTNELESNEIIYNDNYIKVAENLEHTGNYEEAYKTCESALKLLKSFENAVNDYDKKRLLMHKIELYSLRAEKLYNMYLAPEVKDLRTKSETIVKKDNIQKPLISEIYKYNVIKKEYSGMLVQHSDTQKTFYVKVINKTTSFSDENLIIPESIPYMVQLQNIFNCDHSIFLILEYIDGLNLSDHLNKIRLKFENNETLESLYDKAADIDIPEDDDLESSFSELVNNYTRIKKSDALCGDFVVISSEDCAPSNQKNLSNIEFPVATTSTFQQPEDSDTSGKSLSISTVDTETEQIVDIQQNEVIVKWAAQLVLALEKLHTLGVICKDLRLHNLLINKKGDLTLTYMCNGKDYNGIFINQKDLNLAPEVQGIGPVGEEADWWSFGAIFYEILVGMNLNDLHPEYFHRCTILKVPKYVSPEGRSLLRQLLVYEPNKRLGAGSHGVDNLKAHPFFKNIDWDSLLEKSFQ